MMNIFSLFRVANRTFAVTKGQISLVKVVRFTYISSYIIDFECKDKVFISVSQVCDSQTCEI